MDAIGFVDFLEADPRPTFVVDLLPELPEWKLDVIFRNQPLRNRNSVFHDFLSRTQESPELREWIKSEDEGSSRTDNGVRWTVFTVGQRWRVVSCEYWRETPMPTGAGQNIMRSETSTPAKAHGTPVDEDADLSWDISRQPDESVSDSLTHALRDGRRPSIAELVACTPLHTRLASLIPRGVSAEADAHWELVQSIHWDKTVLGAMDIWPSEMLQLVRIVMMDPEPRALLLGDESRLLYNRAYGEMSTDRHPRILGMPFADAWEEARQDVSTILATVRASGTTFIRESYSVFLEDGKGSLVERIFRWLVIPLQYPLNGCYNACVDRTNHQVGLRRTSTLSALRNACSYARNMHSFWQAILNSLLPNERDFPLGFLYSARAGAGPSGDTQSYILEGVLGISVNDSTLPDTIDLETSDAPFAPAFREAVRYRKPVLISTADGTLPEGVVAASKDRGFGDACRLAFICPIRSTGENVVGGFLVIGLNTRRPYDAEYEDWISNFNRTLEDLMLATLAAEEHTRAMEEEHGLLADALAMSTMKATKISGDFQRLQRVMEMVDVGIFEFNPSGKLLQANDAWYKLSNHPRDPELARDFSFLDCVFDPDRELVISMWKVLAQGNPATFEMRWKPQTGDTTRSETGPPPDGQWVLAACVPVFDDEKNLVYISGCTTDISAQKQIQRHLKWAEREQKQRLQEAVEAKRQQENFIDMTSHEIRNPLGAVVHCADSLLSSLTEMKAKVKLVAPSLAPSDRNNLRELFEGSLEAVNTIIACSTHQKRIVDDLLTLSKLDSKLLKISPSRVRPTQILHDCYKMFEVEAEKADVHLEIEEDPSVHAAKVDWVYLDEGRLMQVLINLVTNAIKFTAKEAKRNVTITMGACHERPCDDSFPVDLVPTTTIRENVFVGPEWGSGDFLYLSFIVHDTGCGLTPQAKASTFTRFTQGGPRTHTKYGGSGLGLFISRELTELQGGEIGVASEVGAGSTFGFFVKTRVAPAPKTADTLSRVTSGTASPSEPKSAPEKFNILVVEDNLVNQKVLSKQLKKLGNEVFVASHGLEALEVIESTRYWKDQEATGIELSVVLMDIEMPVMDGITCTRKIRELEGRGDIRMHLPIIAVSANARGEQIDQAMSAGMDDAIAKPFRISDLIPKIERLVNR